MKNSQSFQSSNVKVISTFYLEKLSILDKPFHQENLEANDGFLKGLCEFVFELICCCDRQLNFLSIVVAQFVELSIVHKHPNDALINFTYLKLIWMLQVQKFDYLIFILHDPI